jgi:putative component of membrane protein insertase Oxa1/YidC/SpoIIIJ protein YidD
MFIYKIIKTIFHSTMFSFFGFNSVCQQTPSCSQYTISQIQEHGTIRGLWLGFKRSIRCIGV